MGVLVCRFFRDDPPFFSSSETVCVISRVLKIITDKQDREPSLGSGGLPPPVSSFPRERLELPLLASVRFDELQLVIMISVRRFRVKTTFIDIV